MSKPSQTIINGLLKLHFNVTKTPLIKPSLHDPHQFSTFLSNSTKINLNSGFQSKPISLNGVLSTKIGSFGSKFGGFCRNYSISNVSKSSKIELLVFNPLKIRRFSTNNVGNYGCFGLNSSVLRNNYFVCNLSRSSKFEKLVFNPLNIRQFSTRRPGFGSKIGGNVGKKVIEKPLNVVSKTFSRYKEAIGLQIEGFWKRNILLLIGAGGVVVCITLWRIMFGIANTFVGLSEGMAKYGFLALSSAMVAFAGLYLRSRYAVNPDKVYRMAMRELNTDARSLEVMGAPLAGTDLRAYVMSGGGLTMSKFKPRLRSKSCFIIFPVRGSERKGLVSVHVKKKKGKYDVKLLAVDVPMASGPDQRLFLVGDEDDYTIGGGLIAELRDPVVRAMAATKELEERDDIEAEEDEVRELQEAERIHQEEVARLQQQKSN